MLIKFEIQLDGSTATVTQAQIKASPNLPGQVQLPATYVAPGPVAPAPVAQAGGSPPLGNPGGSAPLGNPGGSAPLGNPGGSPPLGNPGGGASSTGVESSSGSGMVFVLGPIVICGSGLGQTGPGGAPPLGNPGGGKPNGG
jgi:hypothetical protein